MHLHTYYLFLFFLKLVTATSTPLLRSEVSTDGWHQSLDGEINDELEQFVQSVEVTSAVPTRLQATIKFGYEDGMKEALGDEDFLAYIQSVMTHVQSHYRHSESLGTEIEFEV